jgi:hypothetical protein
MFSVLVVGLSLALAAVLGLAALAVFDVAYLRPLSLMTSSVRGGSSAGRAMRARGAKGQTEAECPTCRFHMIGVTPPEALAIADSLRRTQPAAEVRRIHNLAIANVNRAEKLNREHYAAAKIACPLVGADDSCLTFGERPLHCRGWCLHSDEDGDRCLMADANADGGIVRGLNSAGLEGDVYELNSALAVALETPDAAHRWGQAQEVFAGCKRYV